MRTVLASALAVVLGWGTVVLAGPFSMPSWKPAPKQLAAVQPVITRTAHQQPAAGAPLLDAAAVETLPAPADPAPAAAPAAAAPAPATPAPIVIEMKASDCCAPACNSCKPAKACNSCDTCDTCCKPARPKRNCFECGDYCEIVKLWLWCIGDSLRSCK